MLFKKIKQELFLLKRYCGEEAMGGLHHLFACPEGLNRYCRESATYVNMWKCRDNTCVIQHETACPVGAFSLCTELCNMIILLKY
jgi:hypothetical protein